MSMLDKLPKGGGDFDPFFIPDDWARLQYGRMLWKLPVARERLLSHWTHERHPYRNRFESHYRKWVELLLESGPEDDDRLDGIFRENGESLRTILREIPPVFGSFY